MRTPQLLIALAIASPSFLLAQDQSKNIQKQEIETREGKSESESKVSVAYAFPGTAKLDGKVDTSWQETPSVPVKKPVVSETSVENEKLATASVKLMYDKERLYVLWQVKDSELFANAKDDWEQDSVELFVDQNHEKTRWYGEDDAQYRSDFKGAISGHGTGFKMESVQAATAKTDDGYVVEMAVKIAKDKLKPGTKLGLELQVNQNIGDGKRAGITKWHHAENDSWEDTSNFGTLILK